MVDNVPYQLVIGGAEGDILSWDNSNNPLLVSLGLGDFLYRNGVTGLVDTVGAGALAGQGLVADGLGGWAVGNVLASGGAGGGFTAIRDMFVEGVDYAAGGGVLEIEIPLAPPGLTPAEQADSILVLFGGVQQNRSQYSITDNITATEFRTVTFTAPIPEFLPEVEVITLTRPIAASIVFDPSNVIGPPDILGPAIDNVQDAIDGLDTYLVNLDATQVSFDDTILMSGTATNVQEAIDAIATDPGLIPTPFASSLALFEDRQLVGVAGGTATEGSWLPRTLNTFTDSVIPYGAALAADQITLPDGEYLIEFMSIFNTDDQGPLGNVRTRLHNITDDVTEILSMSNVVDGGATIQGNSNSCGFGRMTVAGGPKVFELQYQVEFTRTVRGLGAASNFDTEIYALVKIWQL